MIDLTANVAPTLRRLQALPRHADGASRAVLRAFADDVTLAFISRTPIGEAPSSRRLWQRYETEDASSATAVAIRIVNRTDYLRYVLKGRGPVVATRARALRFIVGGRVMFRKRVGPARANPFDRPVVRQARQAAPRVGAEIARRIVSAYGGG